jgi:CotH kinase protein/Lamin Tail Domain
MNLRNDENELEGDQKGHHVLKKRRDGRVPMLFVGLLLLLATAAVAPSWAALSVDTANAAWVSGGAGSPLPFHSSWQKVGAECPQNRIAVGVRFARAGCGQTRKWNDAGTSNPQCNTVDDTQEGLSMQLKCASLLDDAGAVLPLATRWAGLDGSGAVFGAAAPLSSHPHFENLGTTCSANEYAAGFQFVRAGCNASRSWRENRWDLPCDGADGDRDSNEGLILVPKCAQSAIAKPATSASSMSGVGVPLETHADFVRVGGECPANAAAKGFQFLRGGGSQGSARSWTDGVVDLTKGAALNTLSAAAAVNLQSSEGLLVDMFCSAPERFSPCSNSVSLGFSTSLPIMILNTKGTPASQAKARIISDVLLLANLPDAKTGVTVPNAVTPTTRVEFQGHAALRIRGQSSTEFEKLQYSLELRQSLNTDFKRPVSLLDLPAEEDWVLAAPYEDKSLLRNAVAFQMSRNIDRYAPRFKFVELFIVDDGATDSMFNGLTCFHYRGIYVLTEKIKRGKDRVDVARLTPTDNSGVALTGGYIFKNDKGQGFEKSFEGASDIFFHYPDSSKVTAAQRQYIENYWEAFDQAVDDKKFGEFDGYNKYIDTNTFIEEMLLQEFFYNSDAYRYSSYMYKNQTGKIKHGPIWDLNFALGLRNATRTNEWRFAKSFIPQRWKDLVTDKEFTCRAKSRWQSFRQSVWSDSSLAAIVDSFANPLISAGAVTRNFDRYPILNKLTAYNPYVRGTYAAEVQAVKDYMKVRAAWMDSALPILAPSCPARVEEGLRISEVMAWGDAEFIEFFNAGSSTIPLINLTIQGIDYTFPGGELAPGKYLVLVEDFAAFEKVYGTSVAGVMGEYKGKLKGTGERITISDNYGFPIAEVDYNDKSPWPRADKCPSNAPFSIVPNDVTQAFQNAATGWRASATMNGSPGQADGTAVTSVSCASKTFQGTSWVDTAVLAADPALAAEIAAGTTYRVHWAVEDATDRAKVCRYRLTWGETATTLTNSDIVYPDVVSAQSAWVHKTLRNLKTGKTYYYRVEPWSPAVTFATGCAVESFTTATPAAGGSPPNQGNTDLVSDSQSVQNVAGAIVGLSVAVAVLGAIVLVAVVGALAYFLNRRRNKFKIRDAS